MSYNALQAGTWDPEVAVNMKDRIATLQVCYNALQAGKAEDTKGIDVNVEFIMDGALPNMGNKTYSLTVDVDPKILPSKDDTFIYFPSGLCKEEYIFVRVRIS